MSDTLSPLAALELSAEEKPSTPPPSSSIAASKLNRVRVLGSKKRVASFLPAQACEKAARSAMMRSAVSASSSISSLLRSVMSIR